MSVIPREFVVPISVAEIGVYHSPVINWGIEHGMGNRSLSFVSCEFEVLIPVGEIGVYHSPVINWVVEHGMGNRSVSFVSSKFEVLAPVVKVWLDGSSLIGRLLLKRLRSGRREVTARVFVVVGSNDHCLYPIIVVLWSLRRIRIAIRVLDDYQPFDLGWPLLGRGGVGIVRKNNFLIRRTRTLVFDFVVVDVGFGHVAGVVLGIGYHRVVGDVDLLLGRRPCGLLLGRLRRLSRLLNLSDLNDLDVIALEFFVNFEAGHHFLIILINFDCRFSANVRSVTQNWGSIVFVESPICNYQAILVSFLVVIDELLVGYVFVHVPVVVVHNVVHSLA